MKKGGKARGIYERNMTHAFALPGFSIFLFLLTVSALSALLPPRLLPFGNIQRRGGGGARQIHTSRGRRLTVPTGQAVRLWTQRAVDSVFRVRLRSTVTKRRRSTVSFVIKRRCHVRRRSGDRRNGSGRTGRRRELGICATTASRSTANSRNTLASFNNCLFHSHRSRNTMKLVIKTC